MKLRTLRLLSALLLVSLLFSAQSVPPAYAVGYVVDTTAERRNNRPYLLHIARSDPGREQYACQ